MDESLAEPVRRERFSGGDATVYGVGMTDCDVTWTESGEVRSARWQSETRQPPAEVVPGDDRMSAGTALRLAQQGTALLWRGDFHNSRHLLQAMDRRLRRAAAE